MVYYDKCSEQEVAKGLFKKLGVAIAIFMSMFLHFTLTGVFLLLSFYIYKKRNGEELKEFVQMLLLVFGLPVVIIALGAFSAAFG